MEEVRPPFNPYSAPAAPVLQSDAVDTVVPASRWKRLGAYLLDAVAFFAVMFPAILVDSFGRGEGNRFSTAVGLLMLGGLVALLVIDLILLHRHGQTLGKRLCGIRIVRSNGQRTGLGRLFGVRYLLAQGVLGIVPFFSLIDVLFIFGQDKRCLHDLIADTTVVDV